jgi:CBS domain-containing protein
MPRYTPSVKDYMSPTPIAVSPHDSLDTARKLMREYTVRHLPVIADDTVVGVLSDRDLVRPAVVATPGWRQALVSDAMSRTPYAVSEQTPLNKVARDMARRHISSAVVMDGKKIAGIFTSADALRALADSLEGKHAHQLNEEFENPPPRGRTRPNSPPRARAS